MDRAPGAAIWRYAIEHGYAIMTQDDDFQQMSMLRGVPPKVVHLTNAQGDPAELAQFVEQCLGSIAEFMNDPESSLMLLSRDRLLAPKP